VNGDVENLTGPFGDFGHRASMITKEGFRAASVSATDLLPRQRVVLPNDLSTSLRYLDDPDLQRLLAAVNTEIDRRKRDSLIADAGQAAPLTPSRSVQPRHEHTNIAEIPKGKDNLIRASFGAGLKPATIARTFGVPISLVNRVIRSMEKSQR
jgi:hypothetical protein